MIETVTLITGASDGLVNKAGAQAHRIIPRWLLRKVTAAIKY